MSQLLVSLSSVVYPHQYQQDKSKPIQSTAARTCVWFLGQDVMNISGNTPEIVPWPPIESPIL